MGVFGRRPHDTSYKNRPKNLARETGRIVRDIQAQDERVIRGRISSNLHAIPDSPITTSDDSDEGCCCDRVVYVSKDGAGEFDNITEALNDISTYETPSATEPWAIWICPGDYHEDIVGVDYVSLVGLGTKKDVVRIIGVDGPCYTLPEQAHSVENILFRLDVDVDTPTPILIDATTGIAPATSYHIFSNCQLEMQTESQQGELLRIDGTRITFEHCDFIYDNTALTVGVNTHELFNITDIADLRLISCRIHAEIFDPTDSLDVISETANFEVTFVAKDNRVKVIPTSIGSTGTYRFYNAAGTGDHKYLQDNHVQFNPVAIGATSAVYIAIPGATSAVVTSANNTVLYNVNVPLIANIAATNTLYSHQDSFMHISLGGQIPYINAGTFNFAHSPAAGTHSVRQGLATAALPVQTLEQIDVDEPFWKVIGTSAPPPGGLVNSVIDNADVLASTLRGWVKIEVRDDGNRLTDGDYFIQVYSIP